MALTSTGGAGTVSAIMIGNYIGPNVVTGTYTGDGGATKAITGLGFQPSMLWAGRNATSGTTYMRTDRQATNDSWNLGAGTLVTDGILSFDSDGFTVGNSGDINTNLVVYGYIAIKK